MPPQSPALRAPESESPNGDTKARLLDAVVRLFVERGFHATSMRAITQLAGTSVSAANYHFGSKEELLRAALLQRAEPFNAARLEALARAEASETRGVERIKAIVEAFILPLVEVGSESDDGPESRASLAARLYVDPPEIVKSIQQELFAPVTRHFHEALQKAAGNAEPEAIETALQLSLGVALHSIGGRLVWPSKDEDPSGAKKKKMVDAMVEFAAAGIIALLAIDTDKKAVVGGSGK